MIAPLGDSKMAIIKSADLYFKEGSSDKVYYATIENNASGHVVNFSYGRRGSALKNGTKTNAPVSLEKASDIFDKLVKEKMSKGYRPIANANPQEIHVAENLPNTPTSSKCVLLNPITEEEVDEYIKNDDWVAQHKLDGVRFMLHRHESKTKAYNRRGLNASIPTPIWNSVDNNSKSFLIDGELIGDTYHVFDLLEYENNNVCDKSLTVRSSLLKTLIDEIKSENIVYTEVYSGENSKRKLYDRLIKENQEGIVFKNKNAKYYVGRPASGGDYLKCKFYSTCSAVVTEINDKRSVAIGLYKGKKLVSAGNVTISANFEIPNVGSVVEVKYLYARKQSGSLYQPIYLGERTDILEKECVQSQLKYKSEDE